MKKFGIVLAVVATLMVGWLLGRNTIEAGGAKAKGLSHDVFFTLKDNSPEARQKLIDSCYKHLTKHEGEVFFSAGEVVGELKREVNDRDWDVALHIVFRDMAAHDKYQDHPRHLDFIKEGRDNWKKVRVFDSWVAR